jgi:hypothetical protein
VDHAADHFTDYTGVNAMMWFAPNEYVKTVSVPLIDDTKFELDETFTMSLANQTLPATITRANGTGTITDNDPAPTFSISSDVSGQEGSGLGFTVSLNGSTSLTHAVSFSTGGGTATSGTDFAPITNQILTFAPGSGNQTVTVSTTQDSAIEPDETFTVSLNSPTNGATLGTASRTGTIQNDDVSFSIASDVSAYEGQPLSFTVTKTGTTIFSHSISVNTADGSVTPATAGSDYTAISPPLVLTFSGAQMSQPVSVATIQDSIIEGNETLTLNLSAPSAGAQIGTGTRTGTILNDDVSFSIQNDVSASEGSPLNFTVQKTGQDGQNHSVTLNTFSTGAPGFATAGADYTAAINQVLTFTDAQVNQTFPVATATDSLVEGSETLTLTLSAPTGGAVLGTPTRTGTITDVVPPSLSITSSLTVQEGSLASFAVTRGPPTSGTVTVDYRTDPGTATDGSDYVGRTGTLTFGPGITALSIDITTLKDVYYEGNETFTVTLQNPNGAIITTGQGVGTANIDDANDETSTASAALSLVPNTTGYAPGVTPGVLSVDALGNAAYRIPIVVPPGTAGMEPDLALIYGSGSGNGIVGVGWNVSGLSAITRCPETLAQDGAIDNVEYDADDRFCLDGQRLMVINNGTYGADQAEYRTELDQFARIKSYGAAGSGPATWVVQTKNGRTLEYGNTLDSQIEVATGQNTVRVWAVNKVIDTRGNYMVIQYSDQSSHTDFQPELITYTMNTPGSVTTPFASVAFVYTSRPEVVQAGSLYQGGFPVTNGTNRLSDIRTYNGGTPGSGGVLVRDYSLVYDNLGAAGASRLTSVQECPATGQCLPPTTFAWVGTGAVPNLTAGTLTLPTGVTTTNYELLFGDWNGDGRTDLFLEPKTSGASALFFAADTTGVQQPASFNPAGFFVATDWGKVEGNNVRQAISGDFNGDGLTDIARLVANDVGVTCCPASSCASRATIPRLKSISRPAAGRP